MSALARHAHIPSLARPAESAAALVAIARTPGGTIQVLILPIPFGPALSPIKRRLVPRTGVPVPCTRNISAVSSIKSGAIPAISGLYPGRLSCRLSVLFVEIWIAVRDPFSVLGIVFPGSATGSAAADINIAVEIGRTVYVHIDTVVPPVEPTPV